MVINTFHQKSSLHFTPLPIFHFPLTLGILSSRLKSRHFTSRTITFLTLFIKICDIQGKVASLSASSWSQSWTVRLTKEYFPMSILCSLAPIFRSWSSLLRYFGRYKLSHITFNVRSPDYALKGEQIFTIVVRCTKVSQIMNQFESLYKKKRG
jgi:hypothetical protein